MVRPWQILCDSDSQEPKSVHLTRLLCELYELLGVRSIRTSVYHPQTNGLVEQFSKTLNTMIHKFMLEDSRNWDKRLDPQLFAVREVPQVSMGFSPFELLFRRKPQGVLDLVKENWEMGPSTSKNEGQHILDLWDFTPGPETSTASIQQRSKTHPVIKCLYCYHHLAPNSSPSGTGLLWSHGEWGMLTMRLCILTGVEQHIFTTSTSLKPGRRWRLFLWLPQWDEWWVGTGGD